MSTAVLPTATQTRTDWVLGGVAAELAHRLGTRPGWIRVVLVLAAFGEYWPVTAGYTALALLLPRDDRRLPSWANLVAGGRVALLNLIGFGLLYKTQMFGSGSLLSEAPEVWIPVGGLTVVAIVSLIAGSYRDPGAPGDRRVVLSVTPALALAALVGAAAALVPSLRADRLLDLGLIAAGAALAAAGRRLSAAAAGIALLLLALVAVTLALAGAPLQGGIGALRVAPRSAAAVAPVYRRAAGSITFDARLLPSGATVRTTLSVAFGTVRVIVPQDARGSLVITVGHGTADAIVAAPHSGVALSFSQPLPGIPARDIPPSDLTPPRLLVSVHVGFGCVIIDTPNGGGGSC